MEPQRAVLLEHVARGVEIGAVADDAFEPLVERAQQTLEAEQAERMMKRFHKGQFNMNDLKGQLEQMIKMGGMSGLMGMMPGMGKMQKQMDEAGLDDNVLRRQIALIDSMTKKERRQPDLLQASRKKRIAAGAGQNVEQVNKLLKMHRNMSDMMKAMGSGKRGPLAGIFLMRTAPEARRQGLARGILTALLARSAEWGVRTAFLQVEADNASAIALYKSEGFSALSTYRFWRKP